MSEQKWLDMFSFNLSNLMRECEITQRDLADKTGLSEGTVSNYMHGIQMPGIKAIINISRVLKCSISDLIDFGERII